MNRARLLSRPLLVTVALSIARPIADEYLAGRVTRSWHPRGLPSGIYYVSARLGDREQVRKLVWLGSRR